MIYPPDTTAPIFRRVRPCQNHSVQVETEKGAMILFDFTPRLRTTRFADLKNPELFNSVTTDGSNLIFQIPNQIPVRISAAEFLGMVGLNWL